MALKNNTDRTRVRRGARTLRAVALVVAAGLALAGCTSEKTESIDVPSLAEGKLSPELVASMEAAVSAAVAASGASGAIVGVWIPWSGSWVAGVGTTSIGGSEAMDPEMTFRVGDVTRSMTCDALYGMAADGTVKLDDKVDSLVSGVPNLKEVTLEQLCDSTSGIGSLPGAMPIWMVTSPERVWRPRELASFAMGGGQVAGPGERYVDSDAGYLLLGLALERASGLSASQYLDKYVTKPLGLENTSLPKSVAAAPGENSPEGYMSVIGTDGLWTCAEPMDVTEVSSSTGYTDSGVVSDITDVGSYGLALAKQSLNAGKQDTRYESPTLMSDSAPSWHTTTGGVQFAGTLMGHDGNTLGYATAVWSDPKTGVTVAVMINNSAPGAGIVRALSWELAAMAATAPAAAGETVPEYGVPWTLEEYAQSVRDQAICPIP